MTLDIDHPMSFGLGLFSEGPGLAGKQPHRGVFLLQSLLRGVVQDEADALFIGFEAKFFSDEADIYIGFVSVGLVGI